MDGWRLPGRALLWGGCHQEVAIRVGLEHHAPDTELIEEMPLRVCEIFLATRHGRLLDESAEHERDGVTVPSTTVYARHNFQPWGQHQPTGVVARTSSGCGGWLAQGAADGAVPKDRLNFLAVRPAIKKNVAA